ncbi:ABC transporter ATP-binding protein [Acidocella facilis]|uniref:ABC transporter ATP-binding protein n=1 Tax=Acidocella facilis TaxID=525 RepID=UPI00047BB7F2|nr:sn-glycerol-3-phosphate ABC transporter ATP-binding protein UgpC [Acidocella facilis]
MCTLELKNLRKAYGNVEVIKGVDLTINDREFVVFVGPSGCGKSTLLRMIAGLEEISGGELLIDGVRVNQVPPDKRGLAMVFQSYALYPHMNVADNMAFALRLAGVPKAERDARVAVAAKTLQLDALLDRKPANLSGGQRQRVAIGRAIVRQPKAFLFDEPLSNLDAALRVQTRIEIAKLHNDLKSTMIYVTHDQIEAMTLADRIVVFNAGRIEQVGTPLELYHNPANLFVAGFIGSPKMNLIGAEVVQTDGSASMLKLEGGSGFAVPARLAPGAKVTLGLRPEHIELAPEGGLAGKVEVVEHLGNETIAYADIGAAQPLTVKLSSDAPVRLGETLHFALRGHAASLFDEQGQAIALPGT